MNVSKDDSERVGFFAILDRDVPELQRLYSLASDALDVSRDDTWTLENNLYRRASDVCVHQERVSDGPKSEDAYVSTLGILRRSLHLAKNQVVFTSEEVQTMAEDARAWERRANGEDAIVIRIHRRDRSVPIDIVRAMYRAFKQTLAAAEAHRAGLAMAVYYEGAEQRLAEERADAEAKRRAWERDSPDEQPRDENDPTLFGTRAWLDQHNAQFDDLDPTVGDPPPHAVYAPRHFALVPERYATELHEHIRRAYAADADTYAILDIRPDVQRRAIAHASQIIELRRFGETAVIDWIIGTVGAYYDAPVCHDRDYSVNQVPQMARALDAWISHRGIDGVIDDIIDFPHAKDRALCASAYRAFRHAFTEAARTRCAVFLSRRCQCAPDSTYNDQ